MNLSLGLQNTPASLTPAVYTLDLQGRGSIYTERVVTELRWVWLPASLSPCSPAFPTESSIIRLLEALGPSAALKL